MKSIQPIAIIRTDFPEKFGIPRQSGLVPTAMGIITFLPEFRRTEAVKGLEDFSHIWLLWDFSKNGETAFNPTVRPPRLGGKKRIGVFASRSPFRPNGIGLSSVRLERIIIDPHNGPTLIVSGVDLLDQTPIYDIKPYIPYTDCHTDASDGYTRDTKEYTLPVDFPQQLLSLLPEEKREAAIDVLSHDPRPTFFAPQEREYGLSFAGKNIKFVVEDNRIRVTAVES